MSDTVATSILGATVAGCEIRIFRLDDPLDGYLAVDLETEVDGRRLTSRRVLSRDDLGSLAADEHLAYLIAHQTWAIENAPLPTEESNR